MKTLTTCMAEYKRKRADIMLWCSTRSPHSKSDASTEKKRPKKRSLTFDEEDPLAPTTKKQTCAQKIKDVEAVVDVLTEKHGSKYSVEQLNAWAHMIQMGKHVSTEVPPALPYFGKGVKRSKEKQEDGTQPSSHTSVALSPGKRISLRSECMDQLSKWYSLLEKGVISQSKYDELQETILGDISTL